MERQDITHYGFIFEVPLGEVVAGEGAAVDIDVNAKTGAAGQWRTAMKQIIHQNAAMVGCFAEKAILPRSARSTSGPCALGLETQTVAKLRETESENYKIKKAFPVFIITISFIQMLIGTFAPESIWLYFAYDPYRRHEIWRYFTIMLVHDTAGHLWLVLFFQIILGVLLEIIHHWKRVMVVYIAGVLGGSLFITVFAPMTYAVGASAGLYALFFAHLATMGLNWNEMNQKFFHLILLFVYVGVEVYGTIESNSSKTSISHAGHLGGAVTGLLISTLVLKNFNEHPLELKVQKICKIMLILIFVGIVIINVAWHSHYYPTEFNTNYNKSYVDTVYVSYSKSTQNCDDNEECKNSLNMCGNLTIYEWLHSNSSWKAQAKCELFFQKTTI